MMNAVSALVSAYAGKIPVEDAIAYLKKFCPSVVKNGRALVVKAQKNDRNGSKLHG